MPAIAAAPDAACTPLHGFEMAERLAVIEMIEIVRCALIKR
jgi:hypothetical protein